jgi:hypothetical protein
MSQNETEIDQLWDLQRTAAEHVQRLADHMANIPLSGITVTQERWDQLFGAWDQANARMQEIGRALEKAHGIPPGA